MLATATFDTEAMQAAADGPEVAATDLAEHLVAAGVPFRDAHAIVGGAGAAVARRRGGAGRAGRRPPAAGPRRRGAARARVSPSAGAPTPGGAGPGPVADQLERFESTGWRPTGARVGAGAG